MTQAILPKRALVSVSDKTGLIDLARALNEAGIQILSTGGSAKTIEEAGLSVTRVSEVTEFPEIMGGRVKTLHPRIHGGLLKRRDIDGEVMAEHGIPEIDLVVVNLYPFQETLAKGASYAESVEQIDIGGPAMVRASAKNHAWVSIVTSPADYDNIVPNPSRRHRLCHPPAPCCQGIRSYRTVRRCDRPVDGARNSRKRSFPASMTLNLSGGEVLRYGENSHQQAVFYRDGSLGSHVASAKQLQGKALSFNNIADTDAALECVREFETPACVIVKHANPCGVSVGANLPRSLRPCL